MPVAEGSLWTRFVRTARGKHVSRTLGFETVLPQFKTLPTRPRSHRYILIYIFAMESVKICRFKTFWVRIFARGTLLFFRCFDIHVKMCVLLRYCVRK